MTNPNQNRNEITIFYDHHPINLWQIQQHLEKQAKADSPQQLQPPDLFELDQDHYGGTQAVEVLGQWAGLNSQSLVLEVCSGLGGPARYLAWRYHCRVVGIDLTATRTQAARTLTEWVKLTGQVQFVQGDATRLPFATASFDTCLSQEAFLHIADKTALLAECYRVLAPGGCLVFSDWMASPLLSQPERDELERTIAAKGISSVESYQQLLSQTGFKEVEAVDLSPQWQLILRERLEMYRNLKDETVQRFGEEHYYQYDRLYAFFVELVEAGRLGGARFKAKR
jgi:ubiquinone/menaquinone biosynthesis C-methylase UbiE